MILTPEIRLELARDLRHDRLVEHGVKQDPFQNQKRDRFGWMYIDNLRGLHGTLSYARGLSSDTVVDLGAGSSRAISEIAKSGLGDGLRFMGTGLVSDLQVGGNIGLSNYRITPAEIMRGFDPESVAGIISVYGPFEYSKHLELVLQKADEILVPRGVIKFCVMQYTEGKEQLNQRRERNMGQINDFLESNDYSWSYEDFQISGRVNSFSRIYLAIKNGKAVCGQNMVRDIWTKDLGSMDRYISVLR